MLFPNPDVAHRIMEERVRNCLRKAEVRRLLCEAGIDQRSWLSRRAGRLLACLGHLLVVVGRRLEGTAHRRPFIKVMTNEFG